MTEITRTSHEQVAFELSLVPKDATPDERAAYERMAWAKIRAASELQTSNVDIEETTQE